MLDEARPDHPTAASAGETVTFRGAHLSTENAKLWDLPPEPPPIGVAASGPVSCELAGRYGDALIAVQPEDELGRPVRRGGGAGKPRIGQVGVSYDTDESAAANAPSNSSGGSPAAGTSWPKLPGPNHFAAASQTVTEEDITKQVPCGPTSNRTSTPCASSPMLASPTSPSCKSVATCKSTFFDWAERELLPELAPHLLNHGGRPQGALTVFCSPLTVPLGGGALRYAAVIEVDNSGEDPDAGRQGLRDSSCRHWLQCPASYQLFS